MSEITLDESQLKELLKIAIFEVFQEQKEWFSDLLTEVLEEIAIENAIRECENTEPVSRDTIFKLLEHQE